MPKISKHPSINFLQEDNMLGYCIPEEQGFEDQSISEQMSSSSSSFKSPPNKTRHRRSSDYLKRSSVQGIMSGLPKEPPKTIDIFGPESKDMPLPVLEQASPFSGGIMSGMPVRTNANGLPSSDDSFSISGSNSRRLSCDSATSSNTSLDSSGSNFSGKYSLSSISSSTPGIVSGIPVCTTPCSIVLPSIVSGLPVYSSSLAGITSGVAMRNVRSGEYGIMSGKPAPNVSKATSSFLSNPLMPSLPLSVNNSSVITPGIMSGIPFRKMSHDSAVQIPFKNTTGSVHHHHISSDRANQFSAENIYGVQGQLASGLSTNISAMEIGEHDSSSHLLPTSQASEDDSMEDISVCDNSNPVSPEGFTLPFSGSIRRTSCPPTLGLHSPLNFSSFSPIFGGDSGVSSSMGGAVSSSSLFTSSSSDQSNCYFSGGAGSPKGFLPASNSSSHPSSHQLQQQAAFSQHARATSKANRQRRTGLSTVLEAPTWTEGNNLAAAPCVNAMEDANHIIVDNPHMETELSVENGGGAASGN